MASFFDRFNKKQIETKTDIPGVTQVGNAYVVDSFSFASNNTFYPELRYGINSRWVDFGPDNLFPDKLIDLYYSSPIHSTITNFKSKVMVGGGIDTSKLTPVELIRFETLFGKKINYTLQELALDYQLIGAMAIEVVWNINFTSIAKINRIPVSQVRIGEEVNGKIEDFYVCNNWKKAINKDVIKIEAFDIEDKEHQSQLIYIKNPSVKGYGYGMPGYTSGLNYIAANAAISKYHLSVVNNGFNPGLAIKFFKKPQSPEERDTIVRNIKKEYGGTSNAGKVMILFSDGKELAPEIQPIEVSNLDKQFTVLTEDITNQIVYSHQAVSPILYSIQTSGKLGTTQEFQNALTILDGVVLKPDRTVLVDNLNEILKINGIQNDISIKSMDIFGSNQTLPTK